VTAGIASPLNWEGGIDGYLSLLDQTELPGRETWLAIRDVASLCGAIHRLSVRGAPAIGIAGAFGIVIAAQHAAAHGEQVFEQRVASDAQRIGATRPTAVNLQWAVDRMMAALRRGRPDSPESAISLLLKEAQSIHHEEIASCESIARFGEPLIKEGSGVLTHCNAGPLATGGMGTALAPLLLAHGRGRRFRVYADETRPLLQGARITMWELLRAGMDATLLCDGAAASLMAEGKIQLVIVGADRIARNGDVANKIGTMSVALLARAFGIPFYVAAPFSTVDLQTPAGRDIPIEHRDPQEVAKFGGFATAPANCKVYSPAFDVTPGHLIAGLITERGIVCPVTEGGLAQVGAASPP
jgi:methylthioribose-1-phosphate isomerase